MGWPCMELGHSAEIVSQMVLVVERKDGGFEGGSQILQSNIALGRRRAKQPGDSHSRESLG